MKYCLFDGGDVVGPFLVESLLTRKGFDGHSLVCPEEHSEDETFWKEAYLYAEFGFEAPEPVTSDSPVEEEVFPSEMRRSVEQWNSVEDTPTGKSEEEELQTEPTISLSQAEEEMGEPEKAPQVDESSDASEDKIQISSLLAKANKSVVDRPEALETAKEKSLPINREEVVAQFISAKPNPIEEYFNSVRGGDLGNILGIPDPKANSDMNLALALEKQFEKTDPNSIPIPAEKEEKDPFDSFVRSVPVEKDTLLGNKDDILNPKANVGQTYTNKKPELDLLDAAPQQLATESAEGNVQQSQDIQVVSEMVVPLQEDDPTDNTISTILEGTFKVEKSAAELAEPIKQVPAEKGVEVSSALKQGRVITHAEPEKSGSAWKWIWVLLGAMLLLAGIALNWLQHKETSTVATPTEIERVPAAPIAQDIMVEPVLEEAAIPLVTPAVETVKTPEEQAKEIIQQHVLDNTRGTIEHYLTEHYAQQLAAGYTASWSAEPLHRNVYVVRYRLAKTRQEPIVYVFQADTAKKKLTGALNNITLDLVGKIK